MDVSVSAPDFAAIKQRQRATWAAGDYAVVGTTLQLVGETLCEAVDLAAGERVLDVAAGNGNATLAAARRFAEVTSTDYVGALLDKGRARAAAEGVAVTFQEADAEALPFADGSFDVVLSTFGVMFTADHQRAADELVRVTRAGGRIGLASWTPDSFIGQLFGVIGRHVAPPAGAQSPARWGHPAHLAVMFRGHGIAATERSFRFRYRSADHFLQVFRDWYGPVHRAFAALDPAGQAALEADIRALMVRFDKAKGSLDIASTYLEAVITRA
jgi:SAM-dependent methyltransferase